MTETLIRPNGKKYTPRKGLRQVGFVNDQDEHFVAIMRTHDIERAREFASPYVCRYLIQPRLVWVKQVMRNGEPYFATDAYETGAASVLFLESDDPEAVQSC